MTKESRHVKHHIAFIFSFFILTISLVPAKKIAVLTDLETPRAMELDMRHLYVLENYYVKIFSADNFKLIKKFGNKGEGPGEWTVPFRFQLFPDSLVINTLRKYLVFSLDGSLKYELRKKDIRLAIIWPVGKQFVGSRANADKNTGLTQTISILNKNLETVKEIAVLILGDTKKERKNSPVTYTNAFSHYSRFDVYDDLIFIADSRRGFYIGVFDSNGQPLYKIDKKNEIKTIPVTEKIKSEFLKQNKNSEDIKLGRMFGKNTKYYFPEYFPAFKKIFINSGKIYALTYQQKSNKNEIIVMDLKGKILKRVFLEIKGDIIKVFDGALYYLKDNIINEDWELFREPID